MNDQEGPDLIEPQEDSFGGYKITISEIFHCLMVNITGPIRVCLLEVIG